MLPRSNPGSSNPGSPLRPSQAGPVARRASMKGNARQDGPSNWLHHKIEQLASRRELGAHYEALQRRRDELSADKGRLEEQRLQLELRANRWVAWWGIWVACMVYGSEWSPCLGPFKTHCCCSCCMEKTSLLPGLLRCCSLLPPTSSSATSRENPRCRWHDATVHLPNLQVARPPAPTVRDERGYQGQPEGSAQQPGRHGSTGAAAAAGAGTGEPPSPVRKTSTR